MSVHMGDPGTVEETTVEYVSTLAMIQPSGFLMNMRFHVARLYPARMAVGELAGENSLQFASLRLLLTSLSAGALYRVLVIQ